MVRQLLFLIGFSFLLFSCAEIIPLTGGSEDERAPSVMSQEPEQGSTNFSGNEIVVEFDEYVKLNDPNSTITINPATVKVKTELEKRKLRLFWDGTLQENTTYILQLNGTVRDINEANDSIMQFVFSTGPIIDSLTISGTVVGAYSNSAQNQITVGLYAPDSNLLTTKSLYATRTNAKGEFTFSYLKPGDYQIFAFNDANKDQKPQADEQGGFLSTIVSAGDTIPANVRIFRREAKKNVLRADLRAPGTAVVYNIDSLDLSKLTLNGTQPELLEKYSDDSVLVALPSGIATNFNFAYDSTRISRPITTAERNVALNVLQKEKSNWKQGDSLIYSIQDVLKGVDSSNISMKTVKGANIDYTILQSGNKLILIPDPKTIESFSVRFEKGALSGQTSQNDSIEYNYKTLIKSDLSNLKINCKGFEGQWVFELTQNDKMVYSQLKDSGDTVVEFLQIVPGVYNLRCIDDKNGNGKWDTGSIENKIQPEIIKRFTLTQKLRPNWDVEETIKQEE